MTEIYAHSCRKLTRFKDKAYELTAKLNTDKAKIETEPHMVITGAERARVLAVMVALMNATSYKHLFSNDILYVHTKQKFNRKGLIVKHAKCRWTLSVVKEYEQQLLDKGIKVKYVKLN